MDGYTILAGLLIFFGFFIYITWFGYSVKVENEKEEGPNIKLNPYQYSQYQKKLIDKIIFLRKCGHTYKMISQYFNQINILSYRGKKFSPSLVFELIKKHNRHLEKNKSKLGKITSSKLVYE